MPNLTSSPSGHNLDLLAPFLANSGDASAVSHALRTIQRNQDYLNLLSKLGTDPEAIFDVKPDMLKGALALEFLDANEDSQKEEIHRELQRWALYFTDSLEQIREFISSIISGELKDVSSISDIAVMTQELVDVADEMFSD